MRCGRVVHLRKKKHVVQERLIHSGAIMYRLLLVLLFFCIMSNSAFATEPFNFQKYFEKIQMKAPVNQLLACYSNNAKNAAISPSFISLFLAQMSNWQINCYPNPDEMHITKVEPPYVYAEISFLVSSGTKRSIRSLKFEVRPENGVYYILPKFNGNYYGTKTMYVDPWIETSEREEIVKK